MVAEIKTEEVSYMENLIIALYWGCKEEGPKSRSDYISNHLFQSVAGCGIFPAMVLCKKSKEAKHQKIF